MWTPAGRPQPDPPMERPPLSTDISGRAGRRGGAKGGGEYRRPRGRQTARHLWLQTTTSDDGDDVDDGGKSPTTVEIAMMHASISMVMRAVSDIE